VHVPLFKIISSRSKRIKNSDQLLKLEKHYNRLVNHYIYVAFTHAGLTTRYRT